MAVMVGWAATVAQATMVGAALMATMVRMVLTAQYRVLMVELEILVAIRQRPLLVRPAEPAAMVGPVARAEQPPLP